MGGKTAIYITPKGNNPSKACKQAQIILINTALKGLFQQKHNAFSKIEAIQAPSYGFTP